MWKTFVMGLGLMAVVLVSAAMAEAYSIPPEEVDDQKVFWGSTARFEKPGQVDYQEIVKATPEYSAIRDKKIKSGTAKYWILISKASDHAVRMISDVGQNTDYDLIAAAGYLDTLEDAIPADDITKLVLEKLRDEK